MTERFISFRYIYFGHLFTALKFGGQNNLIASAIEHPPAALQIFHESADYMKGTELFLPRLLSVLEMIYRPRGLMFNGVNLFFHH